MPSPCMYALAPPFPTQVFVSPLPYLISHCFLASPAYILFHRPPTTTASRPHLVRSPLCVGSDWYSPPSPPHPRPLFYCGIGLRAGGGAAHFFISPLSLYPPTVVYPPSLLTPISFIPPTLLYFSLNPHVPSLYVSIRLSAFPFYVFLVLPRPMHILPLSPHICMPSPCMYALAPPFPTQVFVSPLPYLISHCFLASPAYILFHRPPTTTASRPHLVRSPLCVSNFLIHVP